MLSVAATLTLDSHCGESIGTRAGRMAGQVQRGGCVAWRMCPDIRAPGECVSIAESADPETTDVRKRGVGHMA
jgi:hypothetical protein